MNNEQELRIRVHEYWMAFRREYHNVKEGHRPEITHKEVEELIYQIMLQLKQKGILLEQKES